MASATYTLTGGRLRSLRIERGWTQQQLAELAGCSLARVRQIEQGYFDPRRASAVRDRMTRVLDGPDPPLRSVLAAALDASSDDGLTSEQLVAIAQIRQAAEVLARTRNEPDITVTEPEIGSGRLLHGNPSIEGNA